MNLAPDLVEHTTPPVKPMRRRFSLPLILVGVAMVTIVGRSFYLQVVQGKEFRDRAENNRIQPVIQEAPRGIIYDRNGMQLVSNISSTDLIVDPVLLPAQDDEAFLIENILKYVPDVSPEEAREAISTSRSQQQPVRLARSLNHETVLRLQEHAEKLRGTRLVSSLVRDYEDGHAFAHILGYTGVVTAEDIKENPDLLLIDKVGKSGIELQYDESIRGIHGFAYQEINASGRTQSSLGTADPVPGQDLHLTIDAELQKFIYSLYAERDSDPEKVTQGAVIVLDPNNGEVLAAVSYPSFDPDTFSQPGLEASTNYFEDERKPLFNRISDGTYPSGSTIKPFLAGAALEEGLISRSTTILSTGGISVGPWSFPDWKAGGHGITDVTKAIAESVNTFFYAISGGFENQSGLGVKKSTEYLAGFGWGEPTGVDLPSEAVGFLPSQEWKEKVKGEPWYIGDTYHLGIGQGDILVTPLQVASATAGIAHGSQIFQPHLVGSSIAPRQLPISEANVHIIQDGMRQTVTDGSARSLRELAAPLAGKTGTAQIGGTEDTHAWFTSYGPHDDPEFVVTVLLERGGAGDLDAVPFAKEIWQWLIENRLETVNSE